MDVSYGIDLAGYSTGKTRIARLQKDANGSDVHASLLTSGALLKKRDGNHKYFQTIIQEELDELVGFLKEGSIYVDIPVDLQQLGRWRAFENLWEQTNRPIDYALNAMPPLADRIGSPVARFQTILAYGRTLGGAYDISKLVGKTIFETYPAASLKFSNIKAQGYKNSTAIWQDGAWVIKSITKENEPSQQAFSRILKWLCCEAVSEGFELTNDDLDAIIAALPGIVPAQCLIGNQELEDIIRRHLEEKQTTTQQSLLPNGFAIIKHQPFSRITVNRG